MNTLQYLWHSPLAVRAGWTILHSLWQGGAVALVLAAAKTAMQRRSANARYVVSAAALLLIPVMAALTFARLGGAAGGVARGGAVPVLAASTDVASIPIEAASRPSLAARFNAIAPWVAAAWALGVVVLGIRQVAGWLVVRRLRRNSAEIEDAGIVEMFRDLSRRIGAGARVRLAKSALVTSPSVVGWLWPLVLLPAGALTGLSADQLRGLIAHELAHVRRHDYLANLMQCAIETLLFFNPAVWWIGGHIRQERENCCDDIAAAAGDRAEYARALADLEAQRWQWQTALSARGGALLPRIRRLLGRNENRSNWSLAGSALALLVLIVFAGLLAERARAQAAATQPAGVFYISGVDRTGVYEIGGRAIRVRGALIVSGFKDNPGHQSLALIRRGADGQQTRQTLDPSKVLNDSTGGPELKADDILIVSDIAPQLPGEYFVAGDTPRDGAYSLRSGDDVTLLQALIAAGLNPAEVQDDRVRVIRRHSDKPEDQFLFSVKQLLNENGIPLVIAPEGVVMVIAPGKVTLVVDPNTAGGAAANPRRILLVISPDTLTLEGQTVTPDTLEEALSTFHDLPNTILEVAISTEDMPLRRQREIWLSAGQLVQKLHMKNLSDVGVHVIGSKAGDK